GLAYAALDVTERLVLDGRLRDGVLERKWSRRDQPFAHGRVLTISPRVQVLTECECRVEIVGAVERRRRQQVVIDDQIVLIIANHLAWAIVRRRLRERLQP